MADALLITNMRHLRSVLQMLPVLICDRQKKTKAKCIWETSKGKINWRRQQIVIGSYFKSNPTQKRCWKWTMHIWIEFAKINTSQSLSDKAKLILQKGRVSNKEIRGIFGLVNREEHTQRDLPKRIETQNIENQTITEPRNTLMLAQEDRRNVDLMKKESCLKRRLLYHH